MMSRPTACLIASLLAASPALSQQQAACPPVAGKPLVSVDLFDGPVEDNAILAPDTSSGSAAKGKARWDVAYVYEAGRYVVLGCHYKGQDKPAYVEIKTRVKQCEQTIDSKAGGSLVCR